VKINLKHSCFFFLICLLLIGKIQGQQRINPGRVYQSNDSIYGPLYGIKAVVPQGWLGILPQGTRVFTLMPENSIKDNIFVFAMKEDLPSIQKRWESGIEIATGINAFINSEPEVSNNRIYAEFTQTNDANKRIIGEARCGQFGNCITVFALTDERGIVDARKGLKAFTKSIVFVKPGLENIYDNFNWAEYLDGKYIFNFQSNQYYRKENHLWLCKDGSFKTNLKRKGILKEEAKAYTGKKKGKYEIIGTGKFGKIILKFDKAAPLEIDTEIRDDKVIINGFQFFVTAHSNCQ